MRRNRSCILLLALMMLPATARAAEKLQRVDFAREVLPILADNCFRCHGFDAGSREAGLRLDVLDPAIGPLAPRDGYAIITPGDPDNSALIKRITTTNDNDIMPPPHTNKRLTAEQIEVLKNWIEQGAQWGEHWAYIKPERPEVPGPKDPSWARNDIDRFILARLESEAIEPAPRADKHTLLRRVSLDLTGLPPTPAELDAFLADESPDAYEKQVDRLLASPHYGERQARHWLDAARYADSNGYSHDFPRSIWPWRDWVINALNADMPFDQFTIEQLAGDLLPDCTLEQKIATGFHRNTQINTEGGIDPEQFRYEAVVDRVGTTGTVFLGLTLSCAQCHDHKFDPLSQKEFFQLFAFFNNSDEPTLKVPGVTDPEQVRVLKQRVKTLEAAVKEKVAKWEASLTDEQRATLSDEARAALAIPADQRDDKQREAVYAALRKADNDFGAMVDDVAAVRKQLSDGHTTLVLAERTENLRQSMIYLQGDYTRPSETVQPAVPQILHPLQIDEDRPPTRLDLARWIVDPDNPLTARVIVNRIWQQYFGRGIVETENDFGSQGIQPTHPELLDYLATEFIAAGWSMKRMHRLIVTSATYQQSSHARPELHIIDPYNKLYARQNRKRLEAEIVRDVALASSGLLHPRIGGPSVFPPIPDGVVGLGQVKHHWPTSEGPDRFRRGMYTFTFRNSLHPALATFDAPDANAPCTRRLRSNTPLQALNLLNDVAWMEFARGLAARALRDLQTEDDTARLGYAFRLATSRSAEADELKILADLLNRKRRDFAEDPASAVPLTKDVPEGAAKDEFAAWIIVARTILNLDETISRE